MPLFAALSYKPFVMLAKSPNLATSSEILATLLFGPSNDLLAEKTSLNGFDDLLQNLATSKNMLANSLS
jgi:hypothetical protein